MTETTDKPETHQGKTRDELLRTIQLLEWAIADRDKTLARNKDLTPEQMISSVTDDELFRCLYLANLSSVVDIGYKLRDRGHPSLTNLLDGCDYKAETRYHTLLKERLDRLCAKGKATAMKIDSWETSPFRKEAYCLYTGKEYLELDTD